MGNLFRHSQTLLTIDPATDSNQTGSTYTLYPAETDDTDTAQTFQVAFDILQDGGATSPTTDVTLQTSYDGTNWSTAASMDQLTSSVRQTQFKTITALGPYVRVVTNLGGGTPPDHSGTVRLVSDAAFSISAS